jgi:hypothetical protein
MAVPIPQRPKKLPSRAELVKNLTADTRTDEELVRAGIQTAAVGIRENLMEYFKDSCVDRVSQHNDTYLRPANRETMYYFERRERDIAQENVLKIRHNDVTLARLRKEPDQITFYGKVITRTPEMTMLYAEVRTFIEKYLQGVKSVEDNDVRLASRSLDGSGDREYFMGLTRRLTSVRSDDEQPYDQVHRVSPHMWYAIDADGIVRPVSEEYARLSEQYHRRQRVNYIDVNPWVTTASIRPEFVQNYTWTTARTDD